MRKAKLTHVHAVSPGHWEGILATSPPNDTAAMLFVVGPYKSNRAAGARAAALNRTGYASRGGLYVVSDELLGELVAQVAGCLNGPGEYRF